MTDANGHDRSFPYSASVASNFVSIPTNALDSVQFEVITGSTGGMWVNMRIINDDDAGGFTSIHRVDILDDLITVLQYYKDHVITSPKFRDK